MFGRLLKTTRKALECSQKQRKYLLDEYKETIEECIYTINQVQDTHSIKHMEESDKEQIRNNIIDNARTKFVTKLLELDNPLRKSNS